MRRGITDEWEAALARIERHFVERRRRGDGGRPADARPTHGPPCVYVVAEPDRGKTTFARLLLDRLAARAGGATYLDCDPGQSTIGPPATIGLAGHDGAHLLRFAGSVTPSGHLLETVGGIAALASRADVAHPLIVDSSGYTSGAAAEHFQYHVIDLLRPDVVVVLGESASLARVCASFPGTPGVALERVPASPFARRRDQDERRRYRDERFREHFAAAEPHRVALDRVALIGRVPERLTDDELRDRLLAVLDAEQLVVSLGVGLRAFDDGATLELLAPAGAVQAASTIHLGSLRLDRSTW